MNKAKELSSPIDKAVFDYKLIEDGDRILIDIPNRKINLKVSAAEMQRRKKSFKPRPPRYKSGYLAKYTKLATSADTGAILKWD